MEFYDAVKRRRTVRAWSGRDMTEDVLKRILDAGLCAPSHNHRRNWEFIILREKQDKEHALRFVRQWANVQDENREIAENASPVQKMFAYAMPRQYTMLADAPYVVIPVFRADASLFQAQSVSDMNSFAAIWCVIENIFLAAAAEGAACSMRIPWKEEEQEVCALLEIPQGYVMPCYIGVGYPKEGEPELEQHLFGIEEKLHRGKW